MDITGNSVVKMLKNANLKKALMVFQIASIPLENIFHRIQNPACELN